MVALDPENVPAKQLRQLLDPLALWYVPAAHAVHDACPLTLYSPALHGKQLLDPLALWYVPAAHAVHDTCPLPLYSPALHGKQLLDDR